MLLRETCNKNWYLLKIMSQYDIFVIWFIIYFFKTSNQGDVKTTTKYNLKIYRKISIRTIFFASYQDHNWYITLEILNSKTSI